MKIKIRSKDNEGSFNEDILELPDYPLKDFYAVVDTIRGTLAQFRDGYNIIDCDNFLAHSILHKYFLLSNNNIKLILNGLRSKRDEMIISKNKVANDIYTTIIKDITPLEYYIEQEIKEN